jgi:hypothetical protein
MEPLDDDLCLAWSKLEAYAARFALIVQLCAWAAGEASGDAIDQPNIEAGIAHSDWFGNEARRVYSVASFWRRKPENRLKHAIQWVHNTPIDTTSTCPGNTKPHSDSS